MSRIETRGCGDRKKPTRSQTLPMPHWQHNSDLPSSLAFLRVRNCGLETPGWSPSIFNMLKIQCLIVPHKHPTCGMQTNAFRYSNLACYMRCRHPSVNGVPYGSSDVSGQKMDERTLLILVIQPPIRKKMIKHVCQLGD